MCPISLPIRIIHHNSQLHDVKGWDSLQCINNSSTNYHHINTTSTISNRIRSDINDRDCVENTNTTINNNKNRFDTVGNNIQFGFHDVCNDNNAITHETLSHSIRSVVNARDRVENTNTCMDNNKKNFDEVGNNIPIGLQDVYLNNNVINHESLRNSVGSGVNEQDSVGITNAGGNTNKKRFDEVGNNIQFEIRDVYNINKVPNQESLCNSVGGGIHDRDSVGNTDTFINNNKRSIGEVGNNIQLGLQDVYFNNNVMNHESFRNIVGRGVNDRDSVGITTVSINNNKTRIDDVRNNIQFGIQDVYNQNTVLNQESLRNSVGGSVTI